MTFKLSELDECLHVQYGVIFCRNNIIAVIFTFGNSSRIFCTLVTAGGVKGLQMVFVQCKVPVMFAREFNFCVSVFLDSKKLCKM